MVAIQILEVFMLICFGLSWPINAVKNFKAKTAKHVSLPFIFITLCGYFFGIASKFVRTANTATFDWVLIPYFINVATITVNIVIIFFNKRRDKKAEQEKLAAENT